MSKNVDILAFGAHPDDVELAASGTILKHIAAGKSVGIVDLTEGGMGSRGTIETRYNESKEASKLLGVDFRVNLKMTDGLFEINEKNKRLIVEQIRKHRPSIVLANAIEDRHPDHGRGSQLVSEACFLSGLIKFETRLNGEVQEPYRPNAVYHYIQDRYIKPDFIVDVSEFKDKKMEAILAYKTQFYNPESNAPETPISSKQFLSFIESRMIELGRPAGVNYAEGFTVERTICVEDLGNLL